MDKCIVFAIVLLLFCWCSRCNSVDINISDRLEQMEKKLAAYDILQKEVATLKKSEKKELQKEVRELKKTVTRLENEVLDFKAQLEAINNHSLPSIIGARDIRSVPMVAFSAFVDHNIYHLGVDQPIPYNNIITNIGNGFSQYTHVFTCPVTGLYMFTFTVCTDDFSQFIAKLVVDNQNIVGAVSELSSKYREIQGSNTAVIQVSKGQSVWVSFIGSADNTIRSDDDYRFAAFSGFLIQ
ncbi:complement C1q-like protein 3 [Mercenaria mercenaria]|uniref:complement C1q-like protein 3 n=1 Tax=Mercenaria mercenaria TaxID=6596 RepID=UPI00234F0A7D|nr:complement C1q-like protein 3 [Mercenaria mercenaria]